MRVAPVFAILLATLAVEGTGHSLKPRPQRSSAQDLEISGDLPALPAGATRFVTYEELVKLPQRTFSPRADPNFPLGAQLSGVSLDDLLRALNLSGSSQLVAAVCADQYEAHYTAVYRATHDPILVLHVGGEPPARWPKVGGNAAGPYLISHPNFTPAFRLLSHSDEAQVPYGVVALKFFEENAVLDALRPRVKYVAGTPVMRGYRIAFQNCFRCHNRGEFGGHKAGVDWTVLSKFAIQDPGGFRAIIHNPKSRNQAATMPGNPDYDDATLQALTAYFQALDQRGSSR